MVVKVDSSSKQSPCVMGALAVLDLWLKRSFVERRGGGGAEPGDDEVQSGRVSRRAVRSRHSVESEDFLVLRSRRLACFVKFRVTVCRRR